MDATRRAMMNVSGLDFLGCAARIGRAAAGLVHRAGTVLGRWRQAGRSRRALLTMNDHLLKDIGISRVDALRGRKRALR